MNFLIFCLFSFLLTIPPLKAAEPLDADEIKKEFQLFRKEVCKKITPNSPANLNEKYKAITEMIDNKISYIENYKVKIGTSSGYIEALLVSRLGGNVEYITRLSKLADIGKIPLLADIAQKFALFGDLDLVNYTLVAKLIKYFYQQTLLQDLTEKSKIYLSASTTLWEYLQDSSKLPLPTTGNLFKEALLYTEYVKHKTTPQNIFPPLKTQ